MRTPAPDPHGSLPDQRSLAGRHPTTASRETRVAGCHPPACAKLRSLPDGRKSPQPRFSTAYSAPTTRSGGWGSDSGGTLSGTPRYWHPTITDSSKTCARSSRPSDSTPRRPRGPASSETPSDLVCQVVPQRKYESSIDAMHSVERPALPTWTQFTRDFHEPNGLVKTPQLHVRAVSDHPLRMMALWTLCLPTVLFRLPERTDRALGVVKKHVSL